MVVGVIQSRISATDLTLKPGQSVATVEVEVVNSSDQQASFHILLSATGDEGHPRRRWYQLLPMSSSKVPPGTRSTYTVSIVDTPLPGFVGLANITLRIISPELQSEERHVLRLRVEPGVGVVAFEVQLPTQRFQDYPGQRIDIPARLYNRNRNPINVDVACPGLDAWLVNGSSNRLRLLPNRWHDVVFACQIPEDLSLSASQTYPFQVLVVDDNGDSATASGTLKVLPLGYFQVVVEDTLLRVPPRRQWLPNRHANTAQTQLRLENHSNLRNSLHLAAVPAAAESEVEELYRVQFEPEVAALNPGQSQTVSTTIQVDRPWFGWVRTLWIDLQTRLDDPRLELQNDAETLQVQVAPIIPRWLQLLAILVGVGAIAGLSFLQTYRQQHRQLVSTVQFNGVGTQVVSGSTDQTLRQWQVGRWGLHATGDVIRLDKAVRVSQYRRVDNNQLMVGLENGEVQIWDLLRQPDKPLRSFINQTEGQNDLDDRVMALTTTADARYLFSGYGSGLVSQWYVGPDAGETTPQQPAQTLAIPEMAIYDIALVGADDPMLAIAGRYNKLLLWDWSQAENPRSAASAEPDAQGSSKLAPYPVDYPPGGQDDYITSLATAEQTPYRLATADNQGRVMVWDLSQCVDQSAPCTVLDQWQLPQGAPVRDVAFSANGCYLASASDDGRVMLWPLTKQGRRLAKYLQGQAVQQANTHFNSVDIKAVDSHLLVVSGADDHQVRLKRLQAPNPACQ
ncbi:MAG TPA: hypothetical protein V6D06_15875 [Trichocoleus sp.]